VVRSATLMQQALFLGRERARTAAAQGQLARLVWIWTHIIAVEAERRKNVIFPKF